MLYIIHIVDIRAKPSHAILQSLILIRNRQLL